MNDISLDCEKAKKILSDRAARFAKTKIAETETIQSTLLVFNIGKDQKYGVDFDAIEKVIAQQKITPIPGLDPLFSGLIYHKTEFWPVIDLRVLFNVKCPDIEQNFIIVQDPPYRYALTIGSVLGQINYDKTNDLTKIFTEEKVKSAYLLGICQSDIAILDISAILNLLRSTKLK